MDIYTTARTAIHDIYRVTKFICKFVEEVRSYQDNVSGMQTLLDDEFFFLEAFKKLFFDGDTNQLHQFRSLPDTLTQRVNSILAGLNATLAEYRFIALKHGLDFSEAETSLGAAEQATPQPEPGQSESYRDKIRHIVTVLKQKTRASEWALFSKNRIEALVAKYSRWTDRLRHIMMLILLVERRVGSLSLEDIAMHGAGKALGIHRTAVRQLRARSDVPAHFGPLDGSIEKPRSLFQSDESDMQDQVMVTKFTDSFNVSSSTVIIEKHVFDVFDVASYNRREVARMQLELVRKLAWMLQETEDSSGPSHSSATDSKSIQKQGPSTNILPCMGYLPAEHDGFPSLVYKIPPEVTTSGEPMRTLHDYILNSPKPPLGGRFNLALSLTSTVRDVHISGWVHKNIWSRGILVTQAKSSTPGLYLLGWSIARPSDQENIHGTRRRTHTTGGYNYLELELYRHPERYREKSAWFTPKHDIYSLGVVLLEIALWTTMSTQFSAPIAIAKERRELPPVKVISDKIRELSRGVRVAQEMGEEYCRLTRRCLETDFDGVDEDDEEEQGDLLEKFQELVIDQLGVGVSL